ncbi:hypothetical protein RclHR1_17360008 [Rhizophagus clarus]|nr:hypothetical protein RclHR1_17360008 [Rhizophagus clarus]
MSDCSSNSEYSSFTTNKEEEVTLKKIAELKKKITELENTSIIKKEKKNKQEKNYQIEATCQILQKESLLITNQLIKVNQPL